MTFHPNPKQSLLLWKMLTAETDGLRSPMQSKAEPKLSTIERTELVRTGFVELAKQKRGARLVLSDKAWAWASSEANVELLRSNSRNGVIALEGLLHRLIPFLHERGIALAELLSEPRGELATPPLAVDRQGRQAASTRQQLSVGSQIARICAELNAERPSAAIRLAQLRSSLPGVAREAFDAELQQLHAAGRIALYRDDNSAALTVEDTHAAFTVGGEPRHLLYWKE